jgi:hypothetical protein
LPLYTNPVQIIRDHLGVIRVREDSVYTKEWASLCDNPPFDYDRARPDFHTEERERESER